MTPELTALALAALLQGAQIALAGWSMRRDGGMAWNVGPRDDAPRISPLTGRLRRAVDNQFEALALFTIAVLVVTLAGASSDVTAVCAWLFLGARVLYVPAYAFGWSPGRSLIWGVGFVATVAMLMAALFGGGA